MGVIRRIRNLTNRWLHNHAPPDDDSPAARAMAHYRAGVACYQTGKYRRAVQDFNQAIDLAPGHAGMYQHRGAALAELGRFHHAIHDYDRAIHLNPTYADTYLDRGNAYHALGEWEKAIKDYSEAVRLRPRFAEAYANRAAVYFESGQDDLADADAGAARNLGVDPQALERLIAAARSVRRRRRR